MRVLERVSGTPASALARASDRLRRAGAVEVALQAARQVVRRGRCRWPRVVDDSASAARIIAAPVHVVRSTGHRLPSANTSPVQ